MLAPRGIKKKRDEKRKADQRLEEKRKADKRCYTSRKELEGKLWGLSSSLPNSTDSYNPTEAQTECWRGTLQDQLSRNHRDLDLVARHPHSLLTRAQKLASIIHLPKFQMADIMLGSDPLGTELRIAKSDTELAEELEKASTLPILRTHAPTHPLSIQDFISQSSLLSSKQIYVFDPSVQNHSDATYTVSFEKFKHVFTHDLGTSPPYNFLDISNRTRIQFLPRALIDETLETKCNMKLAQREIRSLGRASSTFGVLGSHPEFFVATKAGGISPQHVDHFGKLACTIMLEGVKFWYIPAGEEDEVRRDHSLGETSPGSGSLKIKLGTGMAL